MVFRMILSISLKGKTGVDQVIWEIPGKMTHRVSEKAGKAAWANWRIAAEGG
jgi:Fe-S cluster biosynthesis and repair protein YggX